MSKVLEIAYDETEKRHCPVVLETDAVLKRAKYMHLGMKCVGERKLGDGSCLYDMVWDGD